MDRIENTTEQRLDALSDRLETWRQMGENPLSEVKFSRRYSLRRDRIILSYNEVLAALEAMKAHSPDVVYPFIYALAHTGARREEIRLLKWDHIDFETGYMILKKTKNGTDRRLKMGLGLFNLFKELPRKGDHVFMSQFGWLLSREQIDDTIVAMQKKNPGMKPWRSHDLRHSFSFNFLKKGGDMHSLKAILGHKSIQLTIDL